jgi:hypothetical protein
MSRRENRSNKMANHNVARALADALTAQGYGVADEFGLCMTYERDNDPLKVHVDADGSFAAFNGDDELISEGNSLQDLYAILISKTVIAPRTSSSRYRPRARRFSHQDS